ncbi:head decoration protein [Crenalkalicoccus roseus]|uniref:head decoration protein n=1 Tax=Crenalkalicoccus roseus TaxID=1485588 RepID=UPI001080E858|nr:head decoration protein [Crenalkalicoccus roseus]
MAVLTEPRHAGEFIVSEANGSRSRDAIVTATGTLEAGTVLGRITSSGKYVILAPGASDGSQTAAGILYEAVSGTDQKAVAVVRDAEVSGPGLVWPGSITGPQKATAIAQLAALGVIVRNG